MRLRRIELTAIALTIAFLCFIGGYFTGRKGVVNVVAVETQLTQTQGTATSGGMEAKGDKALPDTPAPTNETQLAAVTDGSVAPGMETGDGAPLDAPPAGTEAAGAPRGGDGRININVASRAELMDLPGIGEVIAGRIIEYREKTGSFLRIDDIMKVSGIGEKKFEAMRDMITVG